MDYNQATLALSKLKNSLQGLYGHRLKGLVVFGDYVKRTLENGDIEIVAVLKDEEISIFQEVERMIPVTSTLEVEFDCCFEIIPTTENRYEMLSKALFENVKKEGMTL